MAADGLVCENDPLVLDVNGEKLTFVQKFKGGGTIRVGKFTVSGAPLVGAPYGALFEVTADGRRLQRVLLPPADEITRVTDTDKDNSKLNDRNTENQKLTQDHIEELKKSGKAGAEIVEALCSNSATFQNKTEFSQDKYKRRKAKKYNTYLTVRKPIARIICDAYYDKAPERVWYLRHDSLAVLLSLANVAAGAKVLVVESCMGVVTAAAVERLGGVGSVCALQLDDRPAPVDAVRQMNLSPAQRSVLFTALASSLLRDREAALRAPAPTRPEPVATAPVAPATAGTGTEGPAGAAEAAEVPAEAAALAAEPAAAEPAAAEPAAAEPAAAEPAAAEPVAAEAPRPAADAMEVDGIAAPISAVVVEKGGAGPGTLAAEAAAGSSGHAPASQSGGELPAAAEGTEAGAGSSAAGPSTGAAADAGQQQQQRGAAGGGGGGGGHGYGSFLPRPEALHSVLSSGFGSCLLANPRVHPTALLDAVWPLLASSATFAVFSPWAQPLAEALSHLQASRNAVMLQLQESWLRPYQVLPSRTHPHMTCTGTGGFVLSGIKVTPPDASLLAAQLRQMVAAAEAAAAPPPPPVGQGWQGWQGGWGRHGGGRHGGRGEGAAAAAAGAGGSGAAAGAGAGEGQQESRENGQGGRGWGRGDRGRGRGGGGGRWNGGGGGRGEGGGSGRGGRGKRGAEDGGTGASPGAKRQAL